MKISIVTPSFNQGRFIEQTIISVLRQDHTNVEHIVIDGGSTDRTLSILKQYPHLRWISERDSGQSNAINKGFRMASGDIFAWLNSDDFYEENIFKTIAQYFEMNPECMILYGDIVFVDKEGHSLFSITGPTIDYERLIQCPDIVRQPSFFWRRIAMKEIGEIDETLHLVMDFDFFLRIGKRNAFHYLKRNLSYYRYYAENKSLSLTRRQIAEMYKVYKKNQVKLTSHIIIFLLAKYVRSFSFYNMLSRFIHTLKHVKKTV